MSNPGFQFVYEVLNRFGDVVQERVFYPKAEDLPILKQQPCRLLSAESLWPIGDFHLLASSIPFENDFSNAVEMIRFGGIAPVSEQRTASDPFVAAGGIGVFMSSNHKATSQIGLIAR
jgi:hypothetical protein